MSHFLKYTLGFLIFLCLNACQQDLVYFTYEPVSCNGWSRQDTLQFYLPDTLTAGTYNLEVGVRHSGKYPYRDLWLELTQYIPNPKVAHEWKERKDTFHIYLANEKGNWNGTGTTGGHFQLLSPVGQISLVNEHPAAQVHKAVKEEEKKYTYEGKKHTLQRNEKYHLQITQIMTDTLLFHISDIGVRLSRIR